MRLFLQLCWRQWHEVRQHAHRTLDAVRPQPFLGETARREQAINVAEAAFHQVRVTPELRRPPVFERTKKALFFDACDLIKFEKDMSRTDEPVLVYRMDDIDRMASFR